MHITVNGERYTLTPQNMMEINKQESIETAQNAIDYWLDVYPKSINKNAISALTEDDLHSIGDEIICKNYANTVDNEFDVFERYGLIKED